jgi:hypothetical protein
MSRKLRQITAKLDINQRRKFEQEHELSDAKKEDIPGLLTKYGIFLSDGVIELLLCLNDVALVSKEEKSQTNPFMETLGQIVDNFLKVLGKILNLGRAWLRSDRKPLLASKSMESKEKEKAAKSAKNFPIRVEFHFQDTLYVKTIPFDLNMSVAVALKRIVKRVQIPGIDLSFAEFGLFLPSTGARMAKEKKLKDYTQMSEKVAFLFLCFCFCFCFCFVLFFCCVHLTRTTTPPQRSQRWSCD